MSATLSLAPKRSIIASAKPMHTMPFQQWNIMRKELQRAYPQLFAGNIRPPLMRGIHKQILEQGDRYNAWEVWSFLARWVRRDRYLTSCVAGAPRLDIEGRQVGQVTAQDELHAKDLLARHARSRAAQEAIR